MAYIWTEKNNKGRNLYGYFRKTVEIDQNIDSAELNIFADNSYQLFVNGNFVQFGPGRFDPRFPKYDKHNILSHLKPGKNVIAVKVNSFGGRTYKSMANAAGLVSFGEIVTKNGAVSLETNETWKCLTPKSYSRYASKISFALPTRELYDHIPEEADWIQPSYDDSSWQNATEVENVWGELSERTIPFFYRGKTESFDVVQTVPLTRPEDIYTFSVPAPYFFEETNREQTFIAYSTWIYSETEQEVTAGLFWGEHWLNGEELTDGLDSENKVMRINRPMRLKQGWNYFFGKVRVYFDIFDFYMSLPKNKGITISARKGEGDELFRRTAVLSQAEYDKYLVDKGLPRPYDETFEEVGGWIYISKDETVQNPCRDTCWDDYNEAFEKPDNINGHTFTFANYPDGFSVLLDLGVTRLFLPRIQLENVKGAVIDIVYSEHIKGNNRLKHDHIYTNADRIISSLDTVDWQAIHPRGGRYVRITVRGAAADVKIKEFSPYSAGYPVQPKGWFNCSDPLLNEIWKAGELTQEINMDDIYADCVGRERGMYIRDVVIQYRNNLVTFGDQALMGRCLELYGQSPGADGKFKAVFPTTDDYTLPDFSLTLMEGYLDYYENTGDTARIETDWNAILGNLKWFNDLADERDDLLLNADWQKSRNVFGNYQGFCADHGLASGGINNVFTCFYLIALRCTKQLAIAIGKTADAADCEKRIDILEKTISEKFWDANKQCFADTTELNNYPPHANLFPILAGAATPEQIEGVKRYLSVTMKNVFKDGYNPESGQLFIPSYAYYLFEGMYRAGLCGEAENLIKQGWGMFLHKGMKTCPEHFVWTVTDSVCHAWSACPTYYLSRYGLGVSFPAAPDFSKVEIEVKTQDITWAEGAIPHPDGLIEVKWHTENGERVFDYVKAPTGVEVKIIG